MRETRWPAARGRTGILIDRPRLQARALDGLGQTLISGDLDAALGALAPGAPPLGLCALAPQGAHALRIGRASALLVTPRAIAAADGWRDGWCATSVDDGWAAVEVSGADAPQALAQATSADLGAGSPSAALPAACRGAVAGDASDLARGRLRGRPTVDSGAGERLVVCTGQPMLARNRPFAPPQGGRERARSPE
jgi:hypothetical protein